MRKLFKKHILRGRFSESERDNSILFNLCPTHVSSLKSSASDVTGTAKSYDTRYDIDDKSMEFIDLIQKYICSDTFEDDLGKEGGKLSRNDMQFVLCARNLLIKSLCVLDREIKKHVSKMGLELPDLVSFNINSVK